MNIEQTKKLFEPRIGTKVKVKMIGDRGYRHGLLDKIDTWVFGGLDCGEYEALFLKQNRRTLVMRLEEIKQID